MGLSRDRAPNWVRHESNQDLAGLRSNRFTNLGGVGVLKVGEPAFITA